MARAFRRWRKTAIAWINLYVDAPLASRIGIFWIKSELEDRAFKYFSLNSMRILNVWWQGNGISEAYWLKKFRRFRRCSRSGVETSGSGTLQAILFDFEKLKRVDDFERYMVWQVSDWLNMWGLLHCFELHSWTLDSDWWPLQRLYFSTKRLSVIAYHSFKWWGEPLEIQIRTQEMHRVAENGFAAHWLYKSSPDSPTHLGKIIPERISIIREKNRIRNAGEWESANS